MADGYVDGMRMVGREGHAVYGDRVFYAVDANRKAAGVVICGVDWLTLASQLGCVPTVLPFGNGSNDQSPLLTVLRLPR